MIKFFVILFCFFHKYTAIGAQTLKKEGLINFFSELDPDCFRQFTWFKDSVIINEIVEIFTESRNDSIIAKGCRVRNYSMIDLTTKRGQDYLTFSDTAKSLTNYFLKEGEGFFRIKHPYDKFIDSLIPASDTVIDGNVLKRVYFLLSEDGFNYKISYFLSSSNLENLFHLSRAVDDRYSGYKVTHILYEDLNNGKNSLSKIIYLRDKLTIPETTIFDSWKTNLRTSNLPITTKSEADKYLSNLKVGSDYIR